MDAVRAVRWISWAALALTIAGYAAFSILWGPPLSDDLSTAQVLLPTMGPGFLAGVASAVGYAWLPADLRRRARIAVVAAILCVAVPLAVIALALALLASMGPV